MRVFVIIEKQKVSSSLGKLCLTRTSVASCPTLTSCMSFIAILRMLDSLPCVVDPLAYKEAFLSNSVTDVNAWRDYCPDC